MSPSKILAVRPLVPLSLVTLLPSLGTSAPNVALPTLATAFGAAMPQVQWVVLAYLLSITALVVGVGRLGDLVGRRRLLLAGVVLFTLACVLGGLAPNLGLLVAARALQGAGAAVMMALGMAFVGDTVPREKIGRAMGLLGTLSAVGTALGPVLGGLLVGTLGWRAIFFVNLPLGLLAFGLVVRFLPADRRDAAAAAPRFDVPGTLLLAGTLAAYALAMTLGRGNFGRIGVPLLAAAAAGAVLFVRVEARAAAPLLRPALLRDRVLSASLATSVLMMTVMMATLVVGPFYLSQALGLSAPQVGLAVAVGPVMTALAGVPAGRWVDRLGARRVTVAGLATAAAGALGVSMAPPGWGVPGYVVPLALLTAGYAMFQTANNTAVMAGASPAQRGTYSALLTLSRNLGLVTGASVMAGLFAHASSAARGMQLTFAVAALLVTTALVIVLSLRAPRRSAALQSSEDRASVVR